jgi:Zn-dependent protease
MLTRPRAEIMSTMDEINPVTGLPRPPIPPPLLPGQLIPQPPALQPLTTASSGTAVRFGRRGWQRVGSGAAATGAVAGKAGLLAKGLLALKSLAFLGKLKVVASMAISVVAYAFIFGPWYAVGLVALIFVHEMGHVVALRAQGIQASAPMFIPFMGAFVKMQSAPRSVREEALSALAGPAAGTVAAMAALALADSTDSLLLRALAYSGFFINLFNLLPMLPLDGGRVAGALHPALWVFGVVVALLLEIRHPSFILTFVLIIGLIEGARRWRAHRAGLDKGYFKVPSRDRAMIAAGYFGIGIVCLWGMGATYIPR